jgi:predicted DCC family thiol-disulfide oxidoreductase YuxK
MNFLGHIKRTLSLDYRSLAFYRCLMGFIVMADVLYRLPDLVNFYTDKGLVPRGTFITEMAMPWSFSFHLANGSTGFALAMFAIHFIFGLMLVFGFKSRWAMIGAYLMTVSVHNRNWLVNNGGDDILRALLFISIFLPLNKYFSIDSALTKDKEPLPKENVSTWGWVFYLQVFVIYYVSYILKDHPMWRSDFTAVYYSSRLDIFASPIGFWLRDFPKFLKLSTIFTIYTEFLGPLLLIFSFIFGRFWWQVRLFVIGIFIALHFGIIATMWIGVFPWTCIVMWLIFLPTPFWDKITEVYRARNFGKLTIYFDGECRFCEKAVLIIREFFLLNEVTIKETQSVPDIQKAMLKENSWVVVNEKGTRFFHFAGMLEVMRHSPVLRWFVPVLKLSVFFVPLNFLYKWVASHRQLMSRYSQYFEFKSAKKPIRWINWVLQISGAFMFVTLLMWNLTTIKKWNIQAPFFQNVTRWIHLYQEWNMFAPFPKMDNIWVEIPAELGDGSKIELLTGDRDIFSIKDQKFHKIVPNEHWRKFYLNVSERTDYARYYGGYLCREWNERNIKWVKDTSLRSFEIVVYSQPNLPNNEKGGISRKLSWKHWCFDEDYKNANKVKPVSEEAPKDSFGNANSKNTNSGDQNSGKPGVKKSSYGETDFMKGEKAKRVKPKQ